MELVSELLQVLQQQSDNTEKLVNLNSGGRGLVESNIIKSANSPFGGKSSKLDGNEKSRVKDASTVFIAKFFDEWKRRQPDTKEKTKVSKTTTGVLGGVGVGAADVKKEGWLGKLLSMLGLAWVGIKAAMSFIKRWIITKLGGVWKWIKSKIGGLWSWIKTKLGGAWKWMKTKLSSLWGWIKKTFSRLWTGLKNFLGRVWGGIRSIAKNIWKNTKAILAAIGVKISGLWVKLTSSKAWKTFVDIVEVAIKAVGDFFKALKDKILSVVKATTAGIKSLIPEAIKSPVKAATQAATQAVASRSSALWSGLKSMVGTGASKVAQVAGDAASGLRSVGGKVLTTGADAILATGGAVKSAGTMTLGAAKKTISTFAKGAMKAAGGAAPLLKVFTKLPIISSAIEILFAQGDISKWKEKVAKGEMSEEEMQALTGKRIIEGVGSVAGSTLGASLGLLSGGTLSLALAVAGDYLGKWIGGLVSDYIIPPKYTKTLGAVWTGTTLPKDEMQDFILKDGQVHKFNSKDEVLGMKQGGAINDFMKGGGRSDALSFMAKAQHLSNLYLKSIAQNTFNMAQNMRHGGSGSNNSSVVMATPSIPANNPLIPIADNRDGYFNSVYALT